MAEHEELSESQRKSVSAILSRLGPDRHTEHSQLGRTAHLNAAHLLVSAMKGEGELQTEEGCKHFPHRAQLSSTQEIVSHCLILLCVLCVVIVELPDETLSLLSEIRPDFLEAFDTLVSDRHPYAVNCYT